MNIKLICVNDQCKYSYEAEITETAQHYFKCMICGSKLKVTEAGLKEVIKKDLYAEAEELLNKWVREYGWDWTLDLIQRNKNQSCYRIYKEILIKRGFIIKD